MRPSSLDGVVRGACWGAVIALSSCGQPTESTSQEPRPTDAAEAPGFAPALEFAGVRSLLAREDAIEVAWEPLPDPALRYRVYAGGEELEPRALALACEVAAGGARATLPGLQTGETLQILVRAVDAAGREDSNPMVLRATPNPVRYVSIEAAPDGDGTTPERASPTLSQAIEEAIDAAGVNLYVTAGRFPERILLFDGITVYGGFGPEFDVEARWAATERTVIAPQGAGDLVVVAPGKRWSGLDRVELDGEGKAGRGLVADDSRLQLVDVFVRRCTRKGLDLRGDEDLYSMMRARLHRCEIRDCGGEGLALRGIGDVWLHRSHIRDTGQEGIEADVFGPGLGRSARLLVEGCTIEHGRDAGVRVDLALLPDTQQARTDPRLGSLRVGIFDSVIAHNARSGVSLDVEYEDAPVELFVDLRGNRVHDNGGLGLHLDVDAAGVYSSWRNVVERNRGEAGLLVTGESPGIVVSREDAFGG
ncbi:MAG TPA: right-handed parallel beta-helix repeat-containing protein, partial [Candidatus Polarisedimenticolia bacterium]|nr:right-handed parallel beta-helix repeat-containing protein [Candidatus Polarisedimenticolia bacterium]